VVFVVQQDDCESLAPHDATDPEFGLALRQSMAAGVEALAYSCSITEKEIKLCCDLPLRL